MNKSIEKLVMQMDRTSGASPADLDAAATALKVQFPPDYVDFMLATDGAEGPIGESGYLAIWPVGELVELNEGSGIYEYAPGLVMFAGDGGNTRYAFDRRTPILQIVSIPFDVLETEYITVLGSSFEEFLRNLAAEEG